LVRFGHLAVSLQVDKGLPRPRCLEDVMAAADPGFAEKVPAEIPQVLKTHVFWVIEQVLVHALIIAYTLSYFNSI
jgi:hypothetical protein